MQAIGTGVNPENGVIWAEPHQLLSWAEAFPKLQTQAGVPKCNSPSKFYTNHLFCLQIIKLIFSFHGETFSIVYFIFKIPFWFGKVGKKKKKTVFPIVPRIHWACGQIPFFPSYVKSIQERKKCSKIYFQNSVTGDRQASLLCWPDTRVWVSLRYSQAEDSRKHSLPLLRMWQGLDLWSCPEGSWWTTNVT